MRQSHIIAIGALNGFLAVALAAVGAHALPANAGEHGHKLFAEASQFHLVHALALVATGLIPGATAWARNAGLAFLYGILAFSGSLYWLAFKGPGSLGALHWITPTGGMALMIGWLFLMMAGLKSRSAN